MNESPLDLDRVQETTLRVSENSWITRQTPTSCLLQDPGFWLPSIAGATLITVIIILIVLDAGGDFSHVSLGGGKKALPLVDEQLAHRESDIAQLRTEIALLSDIIRDHGVSRTSSTEAAGKN